MSVELRQIPVDTETFEIWGDGAIVGFISWRRSTEWLSRGHVSYEVAEAHRCKGYATEALRQIVERAGDPVQVCCAVDNVASRLVIEHCGGERDVSRGKIFQDPTDGKWTISYWVPVKKVLDDAEQKD